MDTKSKNYNENTDVAENLTAAQSPKQKARIAIPCLSWLSLIGGLSALAMVVMLCVMHMDLSDFYNAFASSVYETGDYGGRLKTLMWETAGQFDLLDDTMTASDAQYPQIIGECNLDNYYRYSSPRILYYNPQNGSAYATDSLDGNLTPERAAELYTAYSIAATETESVSILVYYNGPKEFHYLLNGYELTTDGDAGMYAVVNNYVGPNSNLYYNLFGDAGNGVYLFLVEVDDIPMLASLENTWRMNRLAVRIVIAVAVAAVVLALVGLCARRQRKAFVARIMQATSWFYSEVKVVAAFFAFVLFVTGLSESVWMGFPLSLQMFAVAIVCYWCLWYFLMDLIVHRKTYLTHSVICAVCYSAWKVFRRMMLESLSKSRSWCVYYSFC